MCLALLQGLKTDFRSTYIKSLYISPAGPPTSGRHHIITLSSKCQTLNIAIYRTCSHLANPHHGLDPPHLASTVNSRGENRMLRPITIMEAFNLMSVLKFQLLAAFLFKLPFVEISPPQEILNNSDETFQISPQCSRESFIIENIYSISPHYIQWIYKPMPAV